MLMTFGGSSCTDTSQDKEAQQCLCIYDAIVQHGAAVQIELERVSAPPPTMPIAEGRQRGREGVFLRRDSMIAAHDGLISRSRSFAPRDPHDSPSAQYAAMEGELARNPSVLRFSSGSPLRLFAAVMAL